MPGVGIIANPHSKLNKRDPIRPQLLSYIAGTRGIFKLTQTIEELKEVAEYFCKHKIEVLAINGGDGTISQTLSAIIAAYGSNPLPKIAVLKGGTMNMLADNLEVRGNPQEILERILVSYSNNQLVERRLQTLEINGKFGFLFASGTSARFLDKFYQNKTGALGSIILVLKLAASIFFGFQFHKKIVCSEAIKLQRDNISTSYQLSLSILASTVVKMPLGMRYFVNLIKAREKISYSCINLKLREISYKLPLLILRRNRKKTFEFKGLCDRLVLTAKSPIPYTLDGELYLSENKSITISKGPEVTFVSAPLIE